MNYSPIFYTGDGSTTDYSVPFPYLSGDDVSVTVNGEEAEFSFLSENIVQLSSAPANGAKIRIERETGDDNPIVVWNNAVALTAKQLNDVIKQVFYLSQESKAATRDTIHKNYAGVFTAQDKKIVDVGYPSAYDDAATKQYVDDRFAEDIDTVESLLADTETARDAAQASATSAAGSATSAADSASAAAASAAAAATSKTNAASSATAAAASKAAAATSEANAAASATAAAASKTAAAASEANAAASATAAAASKTAAAASEANSAVSATAAAASKNAAATSATSAADSASAAAASAAAAATFDPSSYSTTTEIEAMLEDYPTSAEVGTLLEDYTPTARTISGGAGVLVNGGSNATLEDTVTVSLDMATDSETIEGEVADKPAAPSGVHAAIAVALAGFSAVGLKNVRLITASGNVTPSAGVTKWLYFIVDGGYNGEESGQAYGWYTAGEGGRGGKGSIGLVSVDAATAYAVTIGAGNGGATSLVVGGVTKTTTNGILNVPSANPGSPALMFNASEGVEGAIGGGGGPGPFGFGTGGSGGTASYPSSSSSGSPGTGYGAGGGGGASGSTSGNTAGAAGSQGCLLILEF